MGKKFGKLLRECRKERGLSQWELYGELGEYGYIGVRGGSIISKWETGQRNPPYETVLALERILRLPDGLLMSAAGYRQSKPTPGMLEHPFVLTEKQKPELGKKAVPQQIIAFGHQDRLLELVKNWTKDLNTPVFQFPMISPGCLGVHRSEHGPTCENTSDGIRRRLSFTVDTSVENSMLWECLRQHLQTGGYSWLLEKHDEWEQVGGQELERRADILEKAGEMLKEMLASDREIQGEPTPCFGSTLIAVLVDGLPLKYSFTGEPGAPLYASYCCDFQIVSAFTRESAHAFQSYHKTLIAVLDGHPLTESVKAIKGKRDAIASAIEKGLCELLVRGHVPGNCKHCPPVD